MFNFDLSLFDLERNAQLLNAYTHCTKVVFGGLVLAVNEVKPRNVRFEITTRNWFTKKDKGISSVPKRIERLNKDGSTTIIKEVVLTRDNGTIVTTTTESTTFPEITNVTTISESTNLPVAKLVTAANGVVPPTYELDADRIRLVKTKTVVTPPDEVIEYVTERTEEINSTADRVTPGNNQRTAGGIEIQKVSERRYINQQKPVPKAKPVNFETIDGTLYDQYLLGPPVQGFDLVFWNEGMGNNLVTNFGTDTDVPNPADPFGLPSLPGDKTSNETITSKLDYGDGTEGVRTYKSTLNVRGELTEEITLVVQAKEVRDKIDVTKTTTTPLRTVKEINHYDIKGVLIKTDKTTTTKQDDVNALQGTNGTSTLREETDENGKVTLTTTTTSHDSDFSHETTEEQKQVITPGLPIISFTKNITRDFKNNTQVTVFTETVKNTDGDDKTTTWTEELPINANKTTSEEITEKKDEAIIDDVVVGRLITEYRLSGELLERTQAFKIMNKYIEHQHAWAMFNFLGQQLELGERLAPKDRKSLFEQQMRIFTAELLVGETEIRQGPVLDRIELECNGETQLGVVFAPNAGFDLEWIDGTDGYYRWTINVQTYSNVVVEEPGAIGEDTLGGVYIRYEET